MIVVSHSLIFISKSLSSYFSHAGEALQSSLMFMAGPHYLDMSIEYDHNYFSSHDSHCDPTLLIKNSPFPRFWGFQQGHHEFYDPFIKWLEQFYLECSVANIKFQLFLALSKELGVDADTFARIFQGLLKNCIHRKGKNVDWMKVLVVTHLSSHRKDHPFLVQVIQVFIFFVAQYFISILIVRMSVDLGWGQLCWIH